MDASHQAQAKELAAGIGSVKRAKGYSRIVSGKRTLCYINPRKDGAQLDFRVADVAEAPAPLRKALTIRGSRAVMQTNGDVQLARELLAFVKAGA
jgi:hypothetical protein